MRVLISLSLYMSACEGGAINKDMKKKIFRRYIVLYVIICRIFDFLKPSSIRFVEDVKMIHPKNIFESAGRF